MRHEGFGKFPLGGAEGLFILNGRGFALRAVNDDGFDAFAAHHRAQTAARVDAGWDAVLIQIDDAGGGQSHLPGRPNQGNGCPRAVPPAQLFGAGVNTFANHIPGRFKMNALTVQAQNQPVLTARLSFDDQRLDAEVGQLQAGRTAGVAFLYAAG